MEEQWVSLRPATAVHTGSLSGKIIPRCWRHGRSGFHGGDHLFVALASISLFGLALSFGAAFDPHDQRFAGKGQADARWR